MVMYWSNYMLYYSHVDEMYERLNVIWYEVLF